MTQAIQFLKSRGVKDADVPNRGDVLLNAMLRKFFVHDHMLEWAARDEYIDTYGFAIPNKHALETIAKYAPILEVGAGSGYWAHELRKNNVDIEATDSMTGRYRGNQGFWTPMSFVEELPAIEAIKKYPNRTLLTIWPDLGDAWTGEMLAAYTGDTVIYVGEGAGGCTGNDSFHEILESQFEEIESVGIPQFFGIHDSLFVYRRQQ